MEICYYVIVPCYAQKRLAYNVIQNALFVSVLRHLLIDKNKLLLKLSYNYMQPTVTRSYSCKMQLWNEISHTVVVCEHLFNYIRAAEGTGARQVAVLRPCPVRLKHVCLPSYKNNYVICCGLLFSA